MAQQVVLNPAIAFHQKKSSEKSEESCRVIGAKRIVKSREGVPQMYSQHLVLLTLTVVVIPTAVSQGDCLTPKETASHTDRYGDPLPPGAVMRLGTIRFREALRCYAVSYSPDGKLVASGGAGGVVLWDAQSGKRRAFLESRLTSGAVSFGTGGRRAVYRLAFSPDGRYLATGCEGETIVWELATGKADYLPGDKNRMESATNLVGFTPDHQGVFTGDDYEIRLRDRRTGKDLKRWLLPGSPPLNKNQPRFGTKALSADGKVVASYVFDVNRFDTDRKSSLEVWDIASGKIRRIDGVEGILALSPDHTILAALGEKLTLFDVASGKLIRSWPIERPGRSLSGGHPLGPSAPWPSLLAFSSDGKSIATPGSVWSVGTGKEVCKFDGGDWLAYELCFAPDGKTLAFAKGAWVELWKVPAGKKAHNFPNHQGYVVDLAYSPDSRQLATAGTDGTIRLWDTRTGRLTRAFGKNRYGIRSLAFLPDGQRLLTEHGTSIVIWDASEGRQSREIDLPDFLIRSLAVAHDGKTLLAAGDEERTANSQPRHIREWDVESGKERRRFGSGIANILAIALSPDEKIVAAASDDCSVRLWDRRSGKLVREMRGFREDRRSFRYSLSFSPEGSLLAAVCGDGGTIDLADISLGKYRGEVIPFPIAGMEGKGAHSRGRIGSFALSQDGKTIICSGYTSNTIQLVEVFSGKKRVQFNTFTDKVVFAPDGRTVATESLEGGALIWDLTGRRRTGHVLQDSFSDTGLERLWANLASTDATVAHRAIWALVAGKNEAVPFLRRRVRVVPTLSSARLKQLINELDADNFEERERASRALAAQGEAAKRELLAAVAQSRSLEQRRRAAELLAGLPEYFLPASQLRLIRAIEVFEHSGSREAQEALEVLAEGAAGKVETEEARAALQRLRRQGR